MSTRSLFTTIALLASTIFAVAQETQFSEGYSWRNYLGEVTPPLCPDRLCHYYPTNGFENRYEEFAAWRSPDGNANNATSFMNFRVAFPLNYDPNRTEPYPVILMLHGAGESGRIWSGNFDYLLTDPRYDNNSRNLLHGGNVHQQAANRNPTHPQAFPGIIIFPQASYSGSWASGWQDEPTTNQEYIYEFLQYVVDEYNANINRIYVHGLSNGGRGTWDTATKRPDLFAAVLPMSGLPYNSDIAAERLETTPLRLYQGGRDTNPSPGGAESIIGKLEDNGGTPEYILYPTLAHGVWNTAYGEADFWSWMLSKDKRNIYIFGGSTELCINATKRLGFSYGMTSYQWKKDGVDIDGATTRYLTVTGVGDYTGSYTVEFTRPNGTSDESNPVVITGPGAPITPALTTTGSMVLLYTRDDGSSISNSIGQAESRLHAPAGYSAYQWYRDGVLQETTTVNTAKITHGAGTSVDGVVNGENAAANAGNWTVRVLQNSGCYSNHSNIKTLIYNTGTHTLPTGGSINENGSSSTPLRYMANLGKPQLQAQSATQMLVTWTESVPDEEFFEIWRQNGTSGSPWNMIGTVPANSTQFLDNGLNPGTPYAYSIRAMVATSGRYSRKSATSTGSFTSTLPDTQAPTPPANVLVTDVTETSITISWSPSSDNHLVSGYEVFNGSEYYDIINAPSTTYTFEGLDAGTTYILNVRATDVSGNYSTFPQAVIATTNGATNGLSYKYYATTGLSGTNTNPNQLAEPYTPVNGPNFDFSTAAPDEIGITGNPNNGIAIANAFQNTTDPSNFVLAFDGYIQIDIAGGYRFFTSSDDGSRLYIDGNLLINNDGAQGTTTINGLVTLGVGKHAIRATYFENGGGNIFEVRYNGPAANPSTAFNNAIAIPDNKLFLTNTTFTNYYSKAIGDLNTLATWGTNTDGTGTAPADFISDHQVFTIANRASATLGSSWTVAGASSRVVIGDNITVNLDAALTGKVYANAGTVINLNHTTLPQLVQLDPTSTVNMNVSGTVPAAIYGNLNMNTGATTKTLPVSSTLVNGSLQVNDQVVFKGSASPDRSTLLVAGDVTFLGNSSIPPAAAERYSLIFDGNNDHTLSVNQTDVSLAALAVEGSLTLDFNDTNAHTLNVGMANGSGGLLLRSGATLNLENHNLVVNGAYGVNPTDDSGEININGGNITVATASGQTSSLYFPDEENTHNVNNLSLSNTGAGQINVAGQTKLANQMTVGNGTVINMQGDFVLRSTSDAGSGTARIGPMLNGARINGNITAERFMSGEGRIYRYISSPVENVSVEDLQEFFPITGNFDGASTGTGIVSANTSMWTYSEPAYMPFPSNGGTNQETLERGQGYSAFIREGVATTTWAVTGAPHQGTIPFTLTPSEGGPDEGWNLVGNPYPSPIQWTGGSTGGWNMSGVSNTIYIRENTSATTGGFQSHNGSSGTFNGIIAPGQAFWVRTTSANPVLQISESAKSTADGSFFREGAPANTIEISLSNAQSQDATFIQFRDPATAAFDTELDGVKQLNTGLNLSTLTSDGKAMVINLTTPHYCTQEVALRTAGTAIGDYQLEINNVGSIISNEKVTLIDNFLNTETEIIDATSRTISITSDPASKADGRFVLRFEKPEVRLDMNLTSSPGCDSNAARVNIVNAQPGVTYQAFYNNAPVSEALVADGDYFELPLGTELLPYGISEISLKAGFKTCNNFDLPQTISVQRDTLATPVISVESSQLVTNIGSDATYRWFFEERELVGQNSATLTPDEEGNYFVEVTMGSCVKVSDPFVYLITSLENPETGVFHPYPNPTSGILHLELNPATSKYEVHLQDALGKHVNAMITPIEENKVEIDLTEFPVGVYILSANGYRYRIIKRR